MARRSCSLVVLALLAAGCPPGAPAVELRVLAAASLAEPVRALAGSFERERPGVRVLVSAASSTALERQVAAGAPVDVFVSAAAEPVERLVARGLLDPSTLTVVARNDLVVVVPRGEAAPASLASLARLDRVAVGQAGVPVGEYAREALGRAHLLDALAGKLVGYPDEPAVLSAVAAGAAPAGFVYGSSLVAHPRGHAVERAFVVDPALHAPVVYPAALGAGSARPDLARAFLERLVDEAGRPAFRSLGFGVPAPAPAPAR